ncbi:MULTISPECIES: YkgJ family cysteine cluster protein [unclassified Prochlorococcus]|uniref:YkgJ family cysteine cluster protein n=1 Tax=unclassified Prochlorococcus TaxID=2627481 RepID=UPI000533AE8B|nr:MULTISPECIES: YkgJ family cysteine cluster protein [unclassified Prochlorococcus]KGG17583.1 Fe-S cluster protein [Prochlorococcus sp. MIT 0603]
MAITNEKWSCVKDCGACCKLDPKERTEALSVLSPHDKDLYLSLVGNDGWCRFYNKAERNCSIYKTRPSFCNVNKVIKIFNVSIESKESFLIKCCKEQIRYIYGGRSKEMKRFINNLVN